MSTVSADTPASTAPSTFSRKATGLVRAASLKDVLYFNINMQNVLIGAIFTFLLVPSLYPKANIYLATLVALGISLPISWVYAKLSAVYPRSGGDYVFVSRILHPALGFTSNLSYCIWGIFYIGVSGVFLGIYGIAPLLRVLGASGGNRSLYEAGNWFAEPLGNFVMAVALITVFTAIFIVGGLRTYFRIQSVNFVVASVCLLAVIIWGLVATRSSTLAHVDMHLHSVGAGPLTPLAHGSSSGGFSLKQTLFASIWPWLAFNSAIYSTYMGGEVKRADRTQVIGVMGSLAWAGAWTFALTWSMEKAFGNTFWANLGNAAPAKLGLSTTPTIGELSGYGLASGAIATVLMFGLALWTYVWIAPYTILVTRSMLAWSLDRIGPAKLAWVHPRWHSPVWGLLTVLVLGWITSALYAFAHLSVLTGTIGITASMIVVAVAGAALPYRQPLLWRSSPARGRVAGIPTITLVSVLAIPPLILIEWALISDVNSGASISGNPVRFWVVVGIFLIGLPLYYLNRTIQRRRGVNIDLAYKEIPPE
ncbi:MAG TPA: APC family permease [Solirubrobacteraceae bacterium]|jgi:amino acid transporter|nr:APC family permease [Solirubrobacteraceae bacterium]